MENAQHQPSFEAVPVPPPVESAPGQFREAQPGPAARPESYGEVKRAPVPPQQQVQPALQPVPQQQQQTQAVDFQQQAQIVSSRAPQQAGDLDTIEPVWIKYVKKTIQKNKDDPFVQAQEMSYLQADYLKKRFAKELKVQES